MQKKPVQKETLEILIDKLRQIRIGNNLTQEDFAELLGISYKYYQRVETGKQKDLRFSTLDKFSLALGVDSWQLISPRKVQIKLKSKGKSSPHNRRSKK